MRIGFYTLICWYKVFVFRCLLRVDCIWNWNITSSTHAENTSLRNANNLVLWIYSTIFDSFLKRKTIGKLFFVDFVSLFLYGTAKFANYIWYCKENSYNILQFYFCERNIDALLLLRKKNLRKPSICTIVIHSITRSWKCVFIMIRLFFVGITSWLISGCSE